MLKRQKGMKGELETQTGSGTVVMVTVQGARRQDKVQALDRKSQHFVQTAQ